MTDAHELARYLFEQMDEVAIAFLDAKGTIVGWSAGAVKIFGYEPHEAIGRSANLLFLPEDRERRLFEHELAVAAAGGNMEDDRWMLRKDGSHIWVTGAVKRLHDRQGNPVEFAKVMRNRTDLKTLTERLEEENATLRDKEMKRHELFGTLAHELRNPLAPLLNVAHLLRANLSDSEEVRGLIDILDRQLLQMKGLIENLLDVARAAQGKVKLDFAEVDLAKLLHDVAAAAELLIAERQHNFWLLLPDTPLVIRGDAVRLQQVMANLLDNAIKYTPPGGAIYVRATLDSGEVLITFEDNGIGISPEVLPRIFDLFTQEAYDEQRTRSGLGIGLSLVKELVTLHGGTVQARSDGRNKGSLFFVRLPHRTTTASN